MLLISEYGAHGGNSLSSTSKSESSGSSSSRVTIGLCRSPFDMATKDALNRGSEKETSLDIE